MLKTLKSQYRGVFDILGRYWHAYGGGASLLTSPYLHISVALTALMYPYWRNSSWWDSALATLPNLLGFTLAGFTIWLGFGDQKFQKLVSKPSKNGKPTPYIGVSAGFVHFVAQLVALIVGLIAKAMSFELPQDHSLRPIILTFEPVGHFFGFLAFMYALMTILAVTLAVFRTASWSDGLRNQQEALPKPKAFKITKKRKP